MTSLGQDFRYALCQLARNRGPTVVSVLALALGIGALTLTFSVIDAYLLRPLPFEAPDRLVHLWSTQDKQGWTMLRVAVPDLLDWRDQTRTFEDLAAFNYTGEDLTGGERPEKIATGRVSANVFTVLGVEPVLGRGFLPGEDLPGQGAVAVLSHDFWRRRFDGDPAVLGRTIELGGRQYEIVGVMPPGFVFPLPTTQLWTPRELDTARYGRDAGLVQVVGRLRPGVTTTEARAEMEAIAARLGAAHPDTNADRGVTIVPLRAALNFGYDIFRTMAVVLGVADLFVLLIACANVSSLLLGQALGRAREVSVRTALGASRGRLVRQFLIESTVLAAAGGVVGVLLAAWGVRAVGAGIPDDLYRVGDISIDGPALAFGLAATLAAVLLFGLMPALGASRQALAQALRQGASSVTAARGSLRVQSALVAGEVGMAVLLLVGTVLMIRSYQNLERVDPGFDARQVLTMTIGLPPGYATAERVAVFHRAVAAEVASVPGVTAAATTDFLPLNHETDVVEFSLAGREADPTQPPPTALRLTVSPGYFAVMDVPVRGGRAFTEADGAGAARVVVINETMARNYFSGEDPVGRQVRLDDRQSATIVGVVEDTRQVDVALAPGAQIFVPQAQAPTRHLRVLARTAGEPLPMTSMVSEAVWRVDPNLPLVEIRSLEQVVREFLLPQTAMSATLGALALGALLLAVVGVYGLMAFFVSRRTHEIGIRMALGASPRDVLTMVLRRGLWLTLTGLVAGLAAAVGLAQVMSSLLFGVGAVDPFTFVVVPALLLAVALLSCYVPARRAAALDPLVSLRCE